MQTPQIAASTFLHLELLEVPSRLSDNPQCDIQSAVLPAFTEQWLFRKSCCAAKTTRFYEMDINWGIIHGDPARLSR
ncbi:MAG: hypothetical protein ACRCUY_05955 [Thermoguttaceae bacterium]